MKQTKGGNPDPGLPAAKRNIRLTRRNVLRCGTGIIVAAFPAHARAVGEDVSPVTAELAKYMSEAGSRALPDKVVEETKNHILDTLAAMVSGSELPPGRQRCGLPGLPEATRLQRW